MTKEEFAKPMMALACAFKRSFALSLNDTDEVKDTVMDNWYEFFKEYHVEAFEQIANEWIIKESKPPMISDIQAKTRLLSERMQKKIDEEKAYEEFIKTHDYAVGINDKGYDEDQKKHPFEEGWRITDDGYWVNRSRE